MKTLLRIDASARQEGSHTRQLANYFEKKWRHKHPEGQVIYRDLYAPLLPHLQNSTIEGFYTPQEQLSPSLKEATALSDQLIEELMKADELLISSPLYNLNVPSVLKAYFDQVVRIGHTFQQDSHGYQGLLAHLTAYIITAKGGIYTNSSMAALDFQDQYIPAILQHMGMTIEQLFSLEGTSLPDSVTASMTAIHHLIDKAL